MLPYELRQNVIGCVLFLLREQEIDEGNPRGSSKTDVPEIPCSVPGASLGVSFSLLCTTGITGNSGSDARSPYEVQQNVVIG